MNEPVSEQRPEHLDGLSNAEAAELVEDFRQMLEWYRAEMRKRGVDHRTARRVDPRRPWVSWASKNRRTRTEWIVSLGERALSDLYRQLTAKRINRADATNN